MNRASIVLLVAGVLARGAAPAAFGQPAGDTAAMRVLARHVVQPKETLEQISRRYYGTTTLWQRIAEANGIADVRRLRDGQTLIIPLLEGVEPAPAPRPEHLSPPGARSDASDTPLDRRLSEVPRGAERAAERLREIGLGLFGRTHAWWVILLLLTAGVGINILSFWVGSNIVHMQRMGIGRAAVAGVLTFLVWIGCLVLLVLVFVATAGQWAAADAWSLLASTAAVFLIGVLGTLIVIKLVYRDTFGKTVALAVVDVWLTGCCANPLMWLVA